MITRVGEIGAYNKQELQGLSTDVKPVDVGNGSTYLELDTGNGWVYDKNNVNPSTSNGWWAI
jgi:hypothetical protein